MAFTKRTYVGKGRVHIGPYGGAGALAFIGNVSELVFAHEESKISVEDFTEAGGGEYDAIRRVTAVTLTKTMWDILDPTNLARAVRGLASLQSSLTPIAGETHIAYRGGLIPLDRIPDHGEEITVSDIGTTSYNEGTDWVRRPSGIEVLSDGAIDDESELLFDYTPLASDTIEALVTTGQKYRLFFEGLNEADSGRPVLIDVHKYSPGVAQSLGWIGSEFLSMQTAGDVLKDTSIVGDSLSKFYRVRAARPV